MARYKRIDNVAVNNLLVTCYFLVLRLLKSPEVAPEKKLEIAARMVQRIIPERIQLDSQVSLNPADREAMLASLAKAMQYYRPAVISEEKPVENESQLRLVSTESAPKKRRVAQPVFTEADNIFGDKRAASIEAALPDYIPPVGYTPRRDTGAAGSAL